MKKNNNSNTIQETRVLSEKTPFYITEAYKSARTNIMFSISEKGCKKIIITSAYPKEGKTTTCVNVAVSFAQTGKKTLIIDADMRKPKLHSHFNLSSKTGISLLLSNACSIDDAINATSFENLDCICAGQIPPNPAELLSSDTFDDVLSELEKRYDYIFIDTPPVNIVTDAVILAKKVTGTFLVVRSGYSDVKGLNEAITKVELTGIKPRGIIVNDVVTEGKFYKSRNKYSAYRYRYRYSKYKDYKNYKYYKY